MSRDENSPVNEEETDIEDVEALRKELGGADPAIVISNHCYGLFELAAVYLSEAPPRLAEAQLAIDAFAGIVDSLGDRLGDSSSALKEALAQLRLAWVQLNAIPATES